MINNISVINELLITCAKDHSEEILWKSPESKLSSSFYFYFFSFVYFIGVKNLQVTIFGDFSFLFFFEIVSLLKQIKKCNVSLGSQGLFSQMKTKDLGK